MELQAELIILGKLTKFWDIEQHSLFLENLQHFGTISSTHYFKKTYKNLGHQAALIILGKLTKFWNIKQHSLF